MCIIDFNHNDKTHTEDDPFQKPQLLAVFIYNINPRRFEPFTTISSNYFAFHKYTKQTSPNHHKPFEFSRAHLPTINYTVFGYRKRSYIVKTYILPQNHTTHIINIPQKPYNVNPYKMSLFNALSWAAMIVFVAASFFTDANGLPAPKYDANPYGVNRFCESCGTINWIILTLTILSRLSLNDFDACCIALCNAERTSARNSVSVMWKLHAVVAQ